MNDQDFLQQTFAYLENTLAEKEQETFLNELNRNEERRKQFFQLKDVYDLLEVSPDTNVDAEWEKILSKVVVSQPARRRYITWYMSAAAALLLFLLGYVYYTFYAADSKVVYLTTIVPAGTTHELQLTDGTLVILNAGSTFKYPEDLTSGDRHVILQGEALFKVAKDTEHPFTVQAGQLNIEVLGTSFDVQAYGDLKTIETTLIEGTVRVRKAGSDDESIVLHPSQHLTYSKNTSEIRVEEVNTEIYTDWVDGVFRFQDTRLEDVLKKVATWYKMEVVYKNSRLKDLRFTGALEMKNTVEYNLKLISLTASVKFKIANKSIIVQ